MEICRSEGREQAAGDIFTYFLWHKTEYEEPSHIVHLGHLGLQSDDGDVLVLNKAYILDKHNNYDLHSYQGLLGELLVPYDPLGLALKDLGLAGLLDVVLAESDGQGGHVGAAHAEQKVL